MILLAYPVRLGARQQSYALHPDLVLGLPNKARRGARTSHDDVEVTKSLQGGLFRGEAPGE